MEIWLLKESMIKWNLLEKLCFYAIIRPPRAQTSQDIHYENKPIQIYTENFTTKKWKFSKIKKFDIFFIFLLKT